MIENKWKRFAIAQTLSDWGDIAPDDLYDLMVFTDGDGLDDLFDEHGVLVWYPFEDWELNAVVEQIISLAEHAQEIANSTY